MYQFKNAGPSVHSQASLVQSARKPTAAPDVFISVTSHSASRDIQSRRPVAGRSSLFGSPVALDGIELGLPVDSDGEAASLYSETPAPGALRRRSAPAGRLRQLTWNFQVRTFIYVHTRGCSADALMRCPVNLSR
ncbi:hypothetical protein EVAR_61437_1 [Eumeta japonica]|uniref:Uncharacterized protein n=1 Tax=Eumeta variegata TaxID=151549 RepID=A0A4C1Y6Q9_EUMVA|nr:hypothetical protein EVAR_61437_1 [Eumeta japonica]